MVAQRLPSAFVCLSALSPTNNSPTRFQFWAVQLLVALITTVLEVLNYVSVKIIQFFVSIDFWILNFECYFISTLWFEERIEWINFLNFLIPKRELSCEFYFIFKQKMKRKILCKRL